MKSTAIVKRRKLDYTVFCQTKHIDTDTDTNVSDVPICIYMCLYAYMHCAHMYIVANKSIAHVFRAEILIDGNRCNGNSSRKSTLFDDC